MRISRETRDLFACFAIGSAIGLLLLAVLPGCTEIQRNWIRDNVPLIGKVFGTALPTAAPFFDLATNAILGVTALISAAAAKYKHSGLPLVNTEWTKINREFPHEKRCEKLALLKARKSARKAKAP